MGKKRRRSSTEWMLETLSKVEDSGCENFPPEFMLGLRGALDAGMSCEQITAGLVLMAGVCRASVRIKPEQLLERARFVARVIEGDMKDFERSTEVFKHLEVVKASKVA